MFTFFLFVAIMTGGEESNLMLFPMRSRKGVQHPQTDRRRNHNRPFIN